MMGAVNTLSKYRGMGHQHNPTALATAMATMANLMAMIALLISAAAAASTAPPATAYTNHTVGDAVRWLFDANTNTSATNYSASAVNQTFNLGDYLIFNTNSNATVIQTYNDTTYFSCSFDDAQDNDTSQYYGGDPQFGKALTKAVPLTIEGINYYFSDAEDNVQCQRGMAFEIQVNRGLGLPPSLNQPPPRPYIEPPGLGSAQSPPTSVFPSQENGGFRAAANVRGVFSVLLHLLPFSILIF